MQNPGTLRFEEQCEAFRAQRQLDADRLAGVTHDVQAGLARLLSDTPIRGQWFSEVWKEWRDACDKAGSSDAVALQDYLDDREDFRSFVENLSPVGFEDPAKFARDVTRLFDDAIRTLSASDAAIRVLAKRNPRQPAVPRAALPPEPRPVKWWEYLFWFFIKARRFAAWEAAKRAVVQHTAAGVAATSTTIAEALSTGAEDVAALTTEGIESVQACMREPLTQIVTAHHSATREVAHRSKYWDAGAVETFKTHRVPPRPVPVRWWEHLFWWFLQAKRIAAWEIERDAMTWKDPQLPTVPANRERWQQIVACRADSLRDSDILNTSHMAVFSPADSAIAEFDRLENGAKQAAKLPAQLTISGLAGFLALRERGAQTLAEMRLTSQAMEAACKS